MTEVTLQQLAAGGATRRRECFLPCKGLSSKKVEGVVQAGIYTLDQYLEQVSKWMGFL